MLPVRNRSFMCWNQVINRLGKLDLLYRHEQERNKNPYSKKAAKSHRTCLPSSCSAGLRLVVNCGAPICAQEQWPQVTHVWPELSGVKLCFCVVSLNLILLSRFPSLSGKNSFLPFLSMGQLGLHVGVPGGRFGRESLSCDALAKDSLADPWEPWHLSELSLHPPCTHQALGMDCTVGTMTLGKWLSAAAAILKGRICQLWAVGLLLPAPLSGQHWRGMWPGLASAHHSPAPGPEITRLKSLCLQRAQTSPCDWETGTDTTHFHIIWQLL